MERSIFNDENVDYILRRVFKSLSFSRPHTDAQYNTLLRILSMRTENDVSRNCVFSFQTLCGLINSMPDAPGYYVSKEWEIIYHMATLINPRGPYYRTSLMTATAHHRTRSAKEKHGGYCAKVHDCLEARLAPPLGRDRCANTAASEAAFSSFS